MRVIPLGDHNLGEGLKTTFSTTINYIFCGIFGFDKFLSFSYFE
nr:MAG TPA: hypothetical protein [Caudoviricetes sp.]